MSHAYVPRDTPNLVLAGFMGTGKSTVGSIIASRPGWDFVDTDALIEQMAGMPIKDIFASLGEDHFRSVERQACLQAANLRGTVVATGGGALLDEESRRALERTGVVVLLTCDRETLAARLEESALRGERPLLGEDFTKRIDLLLLVRQALYNSIALAVDTSRCTPQEAATRVLDLYTQAVKERRVGACTV
ncbi:MAG: shikimate kinase [Chloroflexota bacterium]|nr:shikimate kinase [Chloroflexota bacterium]